MRIRLQSNYTTRIIVLPHMYVINNTQPDQFDFILPQHHTFLSQICTKSHNLLYDFIEILRPKGMLNALSLVVCIL